MVKLSDLAGGLGFGRDEEGDARRREDQNVVKLPDGTTVAGLPKGWTEGGYLTPETRAALTESINRALGSIPSPVPYTLPTVTEDLLTRARAIEDEALPVTPQPRADRAVPDDDAEVPGHRLTRAQNGQATIVRCECGRWDGGWLGPRSRRRVLDDHAQHVATELAAAGPLLIPSERADQPRELP